MTGTDAAGTPKEVSARTARTVRDEADSVVPWRDEAVESIGGGSPELVAMGGSRRGLSVAGAMTGLGLEPRTNGLKVRCSTD